LSKGHTDSLHSPRYAQGQVRGDHTGRFQRDEAQAAEAVSHGPRARGPSTRYWIT
jgi:hypothetical protein